MKRLLLADDSVTIQKVVKLSFAGEDVEVTTVDDGERAIQVLEQVRPDVVLADIYMPGRNGFAVCEYVKSHHELARIPVVLLVGTFEPFDQVEASRVHYDGVLTKPFESEQLIRMVRDLIAAAAPPASVEASPQAAEVSAAGLEEVLELDWDRPAEMTAPEDEDSILELFMEDLALPQPEPTAGFASAAEVPKTMITQGAPSFPPESSRSRETTRSLKVQPVETAGTQFVSESDIDAIVERVIKRLSDQVVREVAWEVVPDMAEILIKEQLKAQQHPH